MRYQRCTHFDSGHCYNSGLRNGLNTLGCVGYDRCEAYQIEHPLPESSDKGQDTGNRYKLSRIDVIGSNGNTGESYMGDAMTCDSCGAILKENAIGDLECWNEECTGLFSMSNIDPDQPELDDPYHGKITWVSSERDELYKPYDVVNEPNHYKLFPDTEVINVIRSVLTGDEFEGYCKGNSLKYRLRAGKKDNVEQDIAKAMRYERWLQE